MTCIAFIGPSIEASSALKIVDAQLRPPVRLGDIVRALDEGPSVIAIIDGVFERTPAVWHKEILFALSRGVKVIGGGSMGALRACEMAIFGMIGIGEIYHQYSAGELEDDDEVALLHTSEEGGYRNLSDPMVNIRYGLAKAVDAGIIPSHVAQSLAADTKSLFYPYRHWADVIGRVKALCGVEAADWVRSSVAEGRWDLKRKDAELVLAAAQSLVDDDSTPSFVPEFVRTVHWERMMHDVRLDSSALQHARLTTHVRLFEEDSQALTDRSLLMHLAIAEFDRRSMPRPKPAEALERFRRRRGLFNTKALSNWMVENQVDRVEAQQIAQHEAELDRLRTDMAAEVDAWLPHTLKVDSRWAGVVLAMGGPPSEEEAREMYRLQNDPVRFAKLVKFNFGNEFDISNARVIAQKCGLRDGNDVIDFLALKVLRNTRCKKGV